MPIIIENIKEFIPNPFFPKIYKALYFTITEMVLVKNNLFVFPIMLLLYVRSLHEGKRWKGEDDIFWFSTF